jgi:hypothetical protein
MNTSRNSKRAFAVACAAATLVAHARISCAFECGDVDAGGSVSTTDALAVLQRAVDLPGPTLQCPVSCDVTTTTSPDDTPGANLGFSFPCGDFNGDGAVQTSDALRVLRAALGVEVELDCPVCALVATSTLTSQVSAGSGSAFSITFVGGIDRVAIFSSPSSSDYGSVFSRSIDGDLKLGPTVFVAGLEEGRSLTNPAACASADEFVVAWTDEVAWEYVSTEPTTNASDVGLLLPGLPRLHANADTFGSQLLPSVACLADGGAAVSWISVCNAWIREDGYGYTIRPAHCDNEPEDGSYVRVFRADGMPAGPAELVSTDIRNGAMPIAGLSDGRFVLLIRDRIEVRGSNGQLFLSRQHAPVSSENALECKGTHCIASRDATIFAFTGDDLDGGIPIVVRATQSPAPNRWIRAEQLRASCEIGGRCLATFVLTEESLVNNSRHSRVLGNYVRPFDRSTGQLGQELRLGDAQRYSDGVLVAAIAPGTFLVRSETSTGFTLHRIDVQ